MNEFHVHARSPVGNPSLMGFKRIGGRREVPPFFGGLNQCKKVYTKCTLWEKGGELGHSLWGVLGKGEEFGCHLWGVLEKDGEGSLRWFKKGWQWHYCWLAAMLLFKGQVKHVGTYFMMLLLELCGLELFPVITSIYLSIYLSRHS